MDTGKISPEPYARSFPFLSLVQDKKWQNMGKLGGGREAGVKGELQKDNVRFICSSSLHKEGPEISWLLYPRCALEIPVSSPLFVFSSPTN